MNFCLGVAAARPAANSIFDLICQATVNFNLKNIDKQSVLFTMSAEERCLKLLKETNKPYNVQVITVNTPETSLSLDE